MTVNDASENDYIMCETVLVYVAAGAADDYDYRFSSLLRRIASPSRNHLFTCHELYCDVIIAYMCLFS